MLLSLICYLIFNFFQNEHLNKPTDYLSDTSFDKLKKPHYYNSNEQVNEDFIPKLNNLIEYKAQQNTNVMLKLDFIVYVLLD